MYSVFMDHVKNAFMKDSELKSLVLDDYFSRTLSESQTAWRKTVVLAINHGVPVPIFSAALSYYDGYRCARLPANLLQVFHKTYTLLMVFFFQKNIFNFTKGSARLLRSSHVPVAGSTRSFHSQQLEN